LSSGKGVYGEFGGVIGFVTNLNRSGTGTLLAMLLGHRDTSSGTGDTVDGAGSGEAGAGRGGDGDVDGAA
jgi:hypothetical protein